MSISPWKVKFWLTSVMIGRTAKSTNSIAQPQTIGSMMSKVPVTIRRTIGARVTIPVMTASRPSTFTIRP